MITSADSDNIWRANILFRV